MSRATANLALAGLASSWGLIAVIVAAVGLGAGPLAFLRLALAAATLALAAVVRFRTGSLRPGRRLPGLVVLGALQGAHWLLFFAAVKLGSVAVAVLTFSTAPLVLAVLAPALLPERVSRITLAALVPGTTGIVLVALAGGEGGDTVSGSALAAGLGSAVTYALLVILSKRLLADRAEPLTVAFWDCLVGAVVVAPVLLAAGRALPRGGGEWAGVLLLGVVFTGLSTLAYVTLLRHVTAQAAGVLTFLEPVAAVLLARILLGEAISRPALLGGALVILAGVLVVLLEPAEAAAAEVPPGVGSTRP